MKSSIIKVKKDKPKSLQLELGCMITGRFYEFQELRKGTMNRIRNIVFRKATGLELRELQKKKDKNDEEKQYLEEFKDGNIKKKLAELKTSKKMNVEDYEYIEQMLNLLTDIKKKENEYKKMVESFVNTQTELSTMFTDHIKGLGTLMTAMLLYYFGYCEKASYPSSLQKYAGITPESKLVKGETAGFNLNCRTMLWRLADSFIKHKNPRYKPIYDAEKKRQVMLMENEAENAPKSKLHSDLRSRRKMMKYFLIDYFRVCMKITGRPDPEIYPIAKLECHTHLDCIFLWVENQKKVNPI